MTKRIIMIGIMVLTISATSIMAFASAYSTPAEAAAGLTGKTVESVIKERAETGKTYGAIAKDAGSLEEFKKEMLAIKKAALKEKVEAKVITQEKADEIIAAIENNQLNCDGSGCIRTENRAGIGFGKANGERQGFGFGKANGEGQSFGHGGMGFGRMHGFRGIGQ